MDIEETLQEAFADLIEGSIVECRLEISPFAEAYVVEMAADLSSTAHEMAPRSTLLKQLLRTALSSTGMIRKEYLRVAGDAALFISGIFPDVVESRKVVFSLNDYISIGQTAYGSLDSGVFEELSIKFPQIVDVLNTVSSKVNLTSRDLNRYLKRRRILDDRAIRN